MKRLALGLALVGLLFVGGVSAKAADGTTTADLVGLQPAVPAVSVESWNGGYSNGGYCPQSYGHSYRPYPEYYGPRYYSRYYSRPYYYGRPGYSDNYGDYRGNYYYQARGPGGFIYRY